MHAVQQDGIVFIDEIDKIVVNHETRYGEACPSSYTTESCLQDGCRQE